MKKKGKRKEEVGGESIKKIDKFEIRCFSTFEENKRGNFLFHENLPNGKFLALCSKYTGLTGAFYPCQVKKGMTEDRKGSFGRDISISNLSSRNFLDKFENLLACPPESRIYTYISLLSIESSMIINAIVLTP